MSEPLNLVGQKIGRLTVIEYLGLRKRKDGRHYSWFLCECECGCMTEKKGTTLLSGKVKSCGCYRKDKMHELYYKGGKSKLYDVWRMMKSRCLDSSNPHYHNYGGRGITICNEWLGKTGYENFRKWAESHGYKDGLTLDRNDNNKGYSPENCSWQTMEYQSNHKRNNRYIEMNGVTKTLAMWCKEYGAEYSRTRYRINHGYTLFDALTKPPLFKKGA